MMSNDVGEVAAATLTQLGDAKRRLREDCLATACPLNEGFGQTVDNCGSPTCPIQRAHAALEELLADCRRRI